MSVYHYFPSKEHLLDALVDRAIAGVTVPRAARRPAATTCSASIAQWRAASRACTQLIALHRFNTPTGVRFIEDVLLIHALSPEPRFVAQSFRAIGYYLTGAALDETVGYASGPSAVEAVSDEYIARECPPGCCRAVCQARLVAGCISRTGARDLLEGMRAAAPAPNWRRKPR